MRYGDENKALKELFTRKFKVRVKASDMLLIDDPSHVDIVNHGHVNNTCDPFGGTFTVDDSMDEIAAYLYSDNVRLVGDEEVDDLAMSAKNDYSLTLNDMVELYASVQYVEMVEHAEIPVAHDLLGNYLRDVETRKTYDLHYSPPPEEDMVKIQDLYDLMQQPADMVRDAGQGHDAMSILFGSMFHSSSDTVVMHGPQYNQHAVKRNLYPGT